MKFFQLFGVTLSAFVVSALLVVQPISAQVDKDWFITGLDMHANPDVRYVGIGTTSPETKLHVKGDFTLENTNKIIFKNSAGVHDGTQISRYGGNALRVEYAGNSMSFNSLQNYPFKIKDSYNYTVFSVDPDGNTYFQQSGNFGIGTSQPSARFHLHTHDYPTIKLSSGYYPKLREGNIAVITQDGMYTPVSTIGDMLVQSPTGDLLLDSFENSIRFVTKGQFGSYTQRMVITSSGQVGIGTEPGGYKLNVEGNIRANEITVNLAGADFVFDEDYDLRSLETLENYISENKHLPEIPSATDMENGGASLGELQTKLLQKIEELTLYVISQNKRLTSLEQENGELKQLISELRQQ